ncbi:hypothetical protein GSI_04288 [Ganoderma sinense ZZ0214-1]|uniref:MFS general substrate transporter n=1 Tax=Ganoderma sinense ZZ0214-1 TaxID=1077348 RepID=A0A2G8SIQ8_9APHY|nr:hypothetical protein GSI_04288 [Ganoderma sinense ZZ0214-1]
MSITSTEDERRPLLPEGGEAAKPKKPTPLPKLQIAILMLLHLAEPMTSHVIFPFINQLISELDITGGDEKKVGYYAGLITIKKKRRATPESGVTTPASTSSRDDNNADGPPPLHEIFTRPVVISIANYGALALIEIAFIVLIPLFLSTPIELGGLGLKPPAIGAILGTIGVLDGIIQALFFARAVSAWGPKRVFQLGLSAFVPMYTLYPLMNLYARAHGLTWVVWVMVGLQNVLLCVMDMTFGAVFLFITSSAPDSRALGAVNGVAQVVASVVRAVGPAIATSLFATSLERNWLGGYGVYAILIPFSVALSLVSRYLPSHMWTKPGEDQEEEDADEGSTSD